MRRIKSFLSYVLLTAVIIAALCAAFTLISSERNTAEAETDNKYFTFELSSDNSYYVITDCRYTGTSITIPSSYNSLPVKEIGDEAFYECTTVERVTIPDSIEKIGNAAFYNCYALTSITIPNSVTSVGEEAFFCCKSLESVTIGDSVTSINSYAFSECIALTSVTIGDSVASIGEEAFRYCTSLTSITIPGSVTSINSYAFSECIALTSVIFKNTSKWYVTKTYGTTSGTELLSTDLADKTVAATYLTSNYYNYHWYLIDVDAPTMSGASTSSTEIYANDEFTVTASDNVGITAIYYKLSTALSYTIASSIEEVTIDNTAGDGLWQFYCVDKAGNESEIYYVNLDTVVPTINGAGTSTTGKYINTAFTVTTTDSSSGVVNFYYKLSTVSSYTKASSASSVTIASTAGDGLWCFYCVDKAGNESEIYYVNLDTVAPTITLYAAGSSISNGSYTNVSNVSASAADEYSGINAIYYKSGSGAYSVYTSGTQLTTEINYSFYCVDNAGNMSATYTVTIDRTAPTITLYADSNAISNGSYTNASYVYATATDGSSGVSTIYYKSDSSSYDVYTSGTKLTDETGYAFYCVDNAGNTSATYSATIDRTAPTISGASTSSTGKYTNAAFTVTTIDGSSGVVNFYYKISTANNYSTSSDASTITIAANATNGLYYFYCMDKAGNQSAMYYVYLDTGTPTITLYAGGSVISSGSYVKTSNIYASATDSGSGVKTIYYKSGSGSYASYTSGTKLTDEALYTFYCVDMADNKSAEYTVTMDRTAPTLEASNIKYTSGSNRYTNGTFTVSASDSYSLSSLYYKISTASSYTQASSASSVTISSIAGDGIWYFYSVDMAGNQSATYSVYLDTGAPTITLYAGRNTISSGSYTTASYIYSTAADSISGVSAIYYKSDSGSYAAYISGTQLTTEAVYTFYCIDNVGNQSTEYTVTMDRTAPVLTFTGINYTSGAAYYAIGAFSFTVSDFTSTTISATKDGGTASSSTGTSWSTDALASNSSVCYAFIVTDAAGNSMSCTVYQDTIKPTITLYAGSSSISSGSYTNASNISATAADSVSGVSAIYYKSGSGSYAAYTSGTQLTAEEVYSFYSIDNVGNQSAEYIVTMDRTAPVLTFTGINYTSGATYYAIGAFSFTVSDFTFTTISVSKDGGTASSSTGTSWSTAAPASNSSVCYAFTVTDAAGNSTSYTVYQDAIKPTITLYAGSSSISSGSYTNASNISATAADSVSGVKAIYYKTASSDYSAYNSGTKLTAEEVYSFYCIDNVGNQSTVYTLTLDLTAPTLSSADIKYTSGSSRYTNGAFTVSASDNYSLSTLYYKLSTASSYSQASSASSVTISSTSDNGLWYFYSVDMAGNQSATYSVYLDTGTPTITLYADGSTVSSGSYVKTSNVSAIAADTISGVATIYYKSGSGSYAKYTSGTTLTTEAVYTFYCVDNVGNQSATYTVTLDYTAATLAASNIKYTNGNNRYTNGAFTVTVTDNFGLYELYYKISTATSYTKSSSESSVTISAAAGDGLWYFYSVDKAGNQSATYSVYLDTGTPTITLYAAGSSISSGSYTNASSVSASAADAISGIKAIYYKSGSGSYETYTSGTTLTTEAVYTFYCVDNVGNQSATYTVTLDFTAPVLTFTGINYTSGTTYYTIGAFSFTVSDFTSTTISVSKDGGVASRSTGTSWSTAAPTSNSSVCYAFTVTDAAGNSTSYLVYQDTITPTITLYAGATVVNNGSYTNASNISASAADSVSGVSAIYYKSGSGAYSAYMSGTALMVEAVYTFYCIDNVGNQSDEYVVTLDYTAPQLTFTGINYTNGAILYTNAVFSFTVSDFTSTTISVSQDGGTASSTTGASWSSAVPICDVAITYSLTVTDQAGNDTVYTVYVYNRSSFGNVDEICASYSVGSWYETTLPSKYFASNSSYSAGTYYFADYDSAYAFALAAELSRATTTSNGWSYSSTANASTFIEYTDYTSLYTAADYYAVTRISDRKLMSQTGKGADNSDGSLTSQELTCPSVLSEYSAYKIYFISKNYSFTQPAQGVTGNTRYAYAQYLSDGYSLRMGDQFSLTYETKISTVLGNANCYYQGYYLVTEYDLCGNTQIYIVYIDLEAPALTVAVTYGNGTNDNITYTEDYISSYSGIMRYTEFSVNSIIDNMDSWTFIMIEGSNISSTYLYSDELPVLSYENGYYGSYTITVYDRSANTLSFSVSIAGEAPTITTSSLTNETRVRVTITISDSNNVLTQIHLYKVSYSGEYTEMYYDDDGTALSTSTLVYTLRTGGKYVMVVTDAYGRTVDSGAFFYMKDLPSGTLSGVSDGGLTNGDVTFKYSNSYSVVLYIYVDSSWVTAESALYAQTIGSSYTTIAISASVSTCYEYLIFLYVTDDMNLFVEYTFEIDCIAPSVTIMTAEVGEIAQGEVTRYAFYVTWTETDLTVRYSTTKNATTTTKYTKNVYMTSAGTYYFTVKDATGNTLNFEVVIDNVVSYTLSGNYILYDEGYVSQKSLTLTVNEQIGSWSCVSDNGLEVINGQTIMANGIYDFTITDIYDNSLSITLIIDNIAPDPIITTEDGESLSAGDSINKAFHVTCDEANSVITYSANGSSYTVYSGDYLSSESAHYFRITDKYGNYSIFTITCDYVVKYTVSGDYNLITDVYYISKSSLTLTVNETYASFVVTSDNELTFTSGDKVSTEGVYQVTITDAAGNVLSLTMEIDKTAPMPTITTEGGDNLEIDSSVNQAFIVSCVESTATITYSTNGTSYSAYGGGYLSDAGTHYFRITDQAGNKTEFTITCDYEVKYTLSGNYNTVEDNYYISKSSLTLTVSESYVSFSVSSDSGVTFADGEKVSAEGVYIVTIADIAGNILTLTLEIDKTAPEPIITAENGSIITANGSINQAFVVTCAEINVTITYSASGIGYATYDGAYLSADGTHYFKITDLAGNVTEFTVTCDYAVKYTLSGSYNTVEDNYYISKSSITLTVNETYMSFVVTSNNELTFTSGDKVTAEGVYRVTITDVAGNVLTLTLEIDKTAPEPIITAEDGTNITANGSINKAFIVTAETSATISYSASGTSYATYDGAYLSNAGTHYFKITDLAGNVTEFTVTCDYEVKYTLIGSYNTVDDNYYISKSSLTLTVGETFTSFVVTSNNELTFTSGDKVTTEGVYQVTITDAAGNVLTLTLEIDKTAPEPIITAEDGTIITANGSINQAFVVSCVESTAIITYSASGTGYAIYDGAYLSDAGTHYFKITDLAGNVTELTVTCDYEVKYTLSGSYNIVEDNYYISKSSFTLTVNESYVSFSVLSENGVTFDSGEKITTEGVYQVTIIDAAGNVLTLTLEIDKTAPTPTITAEDGTLVVANGSVNQAFCVTSEKRATITCAVGATSSYSAYNGEYYSAVNVYYFMITDIAGNVTEFTVTCDYSVSYTVGGDYSIINENYYISKTALTLTVNESYVSFTVSSENGVTFASGEKITAEGVYIVTITDAAGNVVKVTLEIDKTAPEPIIMAEDGTIIAANGSINKAFNVTAESGATITVSANGNSYSAYTGEYLSDAGTHYFKITDLAGNKTEFTVTCDYAVKYTLSGSYNTVEDNYYISKSSFTLTVNETYTSFVVTSNNEMSFTSGDKVTTEGVYWVTIADAAGNVLMLRLEIDKTAPVPIITAQDGAVIAANGSVNKAFVVSSAENETVTYSANGSNYSAYDGEYRSGAGTHYFKITDLAGNVTEFTVTCDYEVKYSISGSYNVLDDDNYISNSALTLTINETFTSFYVTSNNEVTFANGEKITTAGVYQVTITDAAGNVLTIKIEIDKTAPEPIITAEDGTPVATNGSINQAFIVTAESNATITYSASGNSYSVYTGEYLSDAGTHYFKIMDLAGNVTEFTVTCDYEVKYTLSGTYNTLEDKYYIANSALTLTVNEPCMSFVVTSNNEVTFASGDKVSTEGVYQVTIIDVAGNVLTLTLEIDKTTPEPIITAEDGTIITANGSINKAFQVTAENGATITYSTNSSNYSAYDGEYLSDAGTHYFIITDLAGNKTEFTVICDYEVKHSISGTYKVLDDDNYISNSALTLTVNESYVSFTVLSENGVTFASGEKITTEGVYQVTIIDVAGNVLTLTLEIDKTAPEPIITAEDGTIIAANGSINKSFNVTAESGATITYSMNGSNYSSYTGEHLSDAGTHYFKITDLAGNKTEFTVTCDYEVKYNVSGNYNTVENNYYISNSALTLTVGETYTSFVVTSNNEVTFDNGEKITVEGVYIVTITDAAGNILTVTLEIDKTAPEPIITADDGTIIAANGRINKAFQVTAENGATISYSASGTGYATYDGAYLSADGTHYFKITDLAGNKTEFTVICDYAVKYSISGTYNVLGDDNYISNTSLALSVNEEYTSFLVASDNGVTFASGEKVTMEGVYIVTITDAAGNVLTVTIEIDKTAPEPIITAEDGTIIAANGSINKAFKVTAESGATITYSASGSGYANYVGEYLSADGIHYFKITDSAGNKTEFIVTCDYSVKYTVSGIYNTVDDNYYISKTALTLTVNESYDYFYVSSDNGYTFAAGETVAAEGVYQVTITDAAGNVLTVTIEIDKTAPMSTITAQDGTLLEVGCRVNQAFAVSCAESTATITYSVTGVSYAEYNGEYLSDEVAYYFRITDIAGNKNEFTVTCDYAVKYAVSGDYNLISDVYYVSKSALTLTVNEAYAAFLVASDNGVTFDSGEKISVEGVYQVTIIDAAGNILTVTLEIDKTAPAPVITTANGESLEAGGSINQAFCVSAEDGAIVTYSYGGTNYVTYDGMYLSESGVYSFRITDAAGNRTEFTITCDYVVKYSVSGSYNTVTDDYYVSKTALTLTVNEDYVYFSVLSQNDVTFENAEKVTDEGVYIVTVIDAAGNVVAVTLEIDKTAPVITLNGVSEGGVTTSSVAVVFSDDVAESYYSIGGVRTELENGGLLTADGAYVISVTDWAGNKSTSSFTIDTTVSVTTSRELADGQILTGDISFTFNEKLTASLIKDGAEVKYSGGKIAETGVYSLVLTDAYGNSLSYSFSIIAASAQSYALSATGYEVEAVKDGALYSLTFTDDGGIVLVDDGEYELTFTAVDGSMYSLQLTVDSVAPTVDIAQTKSSVVISNPSKTVTVALYRDGDEIDYKLGDEITDNGEYTLIVCDELGNTNTYYFTINYINAYGIAVIGVACSAAAGIGFALVMYRKKRSVR